MDMTPRIVAVSLEIETDRSLMMLKMDVLSTANSIGQMKQSQANVIKNAKPRTVSLSIEFLSSETTNVIRTEFKKTMSLVGIVKQVQVNVVQATKK
jgi:hypothetical protein